MHRTDNSQTPRFDLAAIFAVFLSAAALVLPACSTNPKPWSATDRLFPAKSEPIREPSAPVAMLAGCAGAQISWSDLRAGLIERAGAEILEEHALSLALQHACDVKGVSISPDDIARERDYLLQSMMNQSGFSAADAARALENVRARRGLGDHRFPALLERNARLRALANLSAGNEGISVSSQDLALAKSIKYGTRHRARLIVVSSEFDAQRILARLKSDDFAIVASSESLDPSAAQGGLIAPVSLDDPAQPLALRRALAQLSEGRISPPFAVTIAGQSAVAIVRHEGTIPPTTDSALDDAAITSEVRRVRERAAMERIARQLLDDSALRILDADLGRAWDARTEPK